MLELFNKKESQETIPEWISILEESKQRWFLFLEKLEQKIEELCQAAIPELKDLMATDDDIYKRTFERFYRGINGQMDNIRQKVSDTYEEKIIKLYESIKCEVNALHPNARVLSEFRSVCSKRYHTDFEEKFQYWQNQLEKTHESDLEIEYNKTVLDYESTKDNFNCSQCGAKITIEKIFFITTYLPCSHCQTQNTFEPSTQARMIQNFAKELAQQRTSHLYELFVAEENKERDLYHKRHELSLTIIHEKDKNVLQEMQDLENQRQKAITNAPKIYHNYLRAMYDELNKIMPDLKNHHEQLYKNQVN